MSPRQVYRCPEHGEFEQTILFKDDVPKVGMCPVCSRKSKWVPSASPLIGGPTTGAQKE